MPIRNYGVLKGRVTGLMAELEAVSPHYQIRMKAEGTDYRIAVNVKSTERSTSELLFFVDENFHHAVTEELTNLPEGFKLLDRKPSGLALDYIRSNLFRREKMRKIPHNLPGEDNDLNDKLEFFIQRALNDPQVILYAFGSRWGPENNRKDYIFGFLPANGVHDIHMNQGNPRPGPHSGDNGVYQDGALLIHFTAQNRWVAIFLAFQSQAWHTNNKSGHPEDVHKR